MQILVADDDADLRTLLAGTLGGWGYEVTAVADGPAAWQALQAEGAPRLALLDWTMPGMAGTQVCREARQRSDPPYPYLILLTARGGKADLCEGLDAGADDYLVKPVEIDELKARLDAGRRIVNLQDQLLTAQRSLREQASHDPLTGLWNRAAILGLLDREVARGGRDGRPVAVLMTDLDHFKSINDTHGHLAGDAVLRAAAQRLEAVVRPYDAVGRYGGEEFLVVLPGCGTEEAATLAERLRRALADRPFDVEAGELAVTLSVGVAVCEDGSPADPVGLLGAADAALYQAKARGRNRVELAGPDPTTGTGA